MKDINKDRVEHNKKEFDFKDDDDDKPNSDNTARCDDKLIKESDEDELIDSVEDEYTVEINGVEYSHVSTTGGSCNIYETVHVLVPQGNFTNMFIIK